MSQMSPAQSVKSDLESEQNRIKNITDAYFSILTNVGENPEREGLMKTPERAAKALLHFTKGYEENLSGRLLLFCLQTSTKQKKKLQINENKFARCD